MQIESPKEKSLIKLERLADDIRSKATEATNAASESMRVGRSAVVSAYECGKLLAQAKKICGKRKFEPWFRGAFDGVDYIDIRTAYNWIKLSSLKSVSEIKNLSAAYRQVGILPEKAEQPPGTAEVVLFDEFIKQILRECNKIEGMVSRFDLTTIPPERKDEVRAAIAVVKALEEKL